MNNTIKFAGIITMVLLFAACKKDPTSVETGADPQMHFEITGPGINKIFYGNEDYSSGILKLKPNAEYSFILTLSDEAEVRYLMMRLPNLGDGYSGISVNATPAAHLSTIPTLFDNVYTMSNSGSDAHASYLMYGNFTSPDSIYYYNDAVSLVCEGRDAVPNRVYLHIPFLVSSGPWGWVE